MIFVGPAMGGGVGASGGQPRESVTEEYKPNVIAPNQELQKAKRAYQEALAGKRAFWQGEMERWGMGQLSESLVELLGRMGINAEG